MTADAVPAPGSLTVPPLAGWEGIVLALLAVLVVALGFLAIGAAATGRRRRSPEWQAWLDGRSRTRFDAGPSTATRAPAHDPAHDAAYRPAPAEDEGPLGTHLRR